MPVVNDVLPDSIGKHYKDDHHDSYRADDNLQDALKNPAMLNGSKAPLLKHRCSILVMMVTVLLFLLFCHYFLDIV